ncbi:MAG: hypothetical protein ABFE13_18215 [Phycisphaerales bacterium]
MTLDVQSNRHADRIQWLLKGPVLRTLSGTRCRLAILDWSDLQLLCRHFGTDISGLAVCMWTGRRMRKRSIASDTKIDHPALTID